jgi:hypothetical protein
MVIKNDRARTAVSFVLCGKEKFFVAEMDDAVRNAARDVQRVCVSDTVVVGGGSVEVGMSVHLDSFGKGLVCFVSFIFTDLRQKSQTVSSFSAIFPRRLYNRPKH